MSESEKTPWFPAKKHGWGWGFPITWQGWVVFIAFMVLAIAGAYLVRYGWIWFLLYMLGLSSALLAVCWAKGEKPGWR